MNHILISLISIVVFSVSTICALTNGSQFVITASAKLSEGSCGFPVDFTGSTPLAALGEVDFGNTDFEGPHCEQFIEVTGKDGSVKAQIVSKCGAKCVPGTIELSEQAAKQINKAPPGPDGTFPVTWKFV